MTETTGKKRKRESSSEAVEELQELDSEPNHAWDADSLYGLKMKFKRLRINLVQPEHHEVFKKLLEDPVVKEFLAWDKNLRVSDKYLLSMVIAYFSRAGFFSWQYQRIHFFLALYLANDMEEDNQAPKQDIFYFLYGQSYALRPLFHKLRYQFICSMGWNTRVSLEECEEDLRHSASNGHVPGTTVYREKEDMYDEIIELKKSLHTKKSDVDLMRTKLRRLEEENNRKDRQIEQLLDPGRGPDFVRTLAEKRPDAGWVINGLKQRIFKLEQQCKEKDSTINKLQTDMKTTNLEEMRIAMDTYYEEIHRLQTLLASSEVAGKKTPLEKKVGIKRQKKMSSTLLNLSRSVQELTEENQSLKEDLDRVLSNSPTVSKIKGYVDWSKPRLLRRIAELEKKISSMESTKPHSSESHRPTPLAHSASNSAAHKHPRDRPEEQERLRGTVKSLKAERSALQAQLLEKDVEVKQLLQVKADLEKELESAREGKQERQEHEQALREEIQTLTNKCQELEETRKEKPSAPMEVIHEASGELCTPPPSNRHSQQDSELDSGQEGCCQPLSPCPCSDGRREAAARTLQASWKAHKHKKKKAVLNEAATLLQAVFRGHLARAKLLSSKTCGSESPGLPDFPDQSSSTPHVPSPSAQAEDSPGQEEAITIIQSVLRGHLARTKHGR
ncbi:IQ domain-containing protein E [Sciurus carolinensis]|uniref:IQ domain-containing protein E n=1 Tax=Sciurus carolinensis TaxID=30640 RepID=A0AA41T2B9_SCICA|nr:IQ domain-containing protein E [Sciurus carolinensis]